MLLIVAMFSLATYDGSIQVERASTAETEQRYGIQIAVSQTAFRRSTLYGTLSGSEAPGSVAAQYTIMLCDELSVYPPSLVRAAKVKRILLCSNLTFDGEKRTAFPGYDDQTLYVDIERGCCSRYERLVFHHELFHLIDYQDDFLVYSDPFWSGLNRPSFQYGDGGRSMQSDPSVTCLTDKIPGFVDEFSTASVEEDKAELFAYMIVLPMEIDSLASRDCILKQKTTRMQDLLLRFCTDMTPVFWEQRRAASRLPAPSSQRQQSCGGHDCRGR